VPGEESKILMLTDVYGNDIVELAQSLKIGDIERESILALEESLALDVRYNLLSSQQISSSFSDEGDSVTCMCAPDRCDLKIACILQDPKNKWRKILVWSGTCLIDEGFLFVLTDDDGNIIEK